MLKKVLSAVLAGVMTLALAVPAFATDPVPKNPSSIEPTTTSGAWYTGTGTNGSGMYSGSDAGGSGLQGAKFQTEYTSETKVPYLEVVITGNGGLILNPYRVDYSQQSVQWGSNPSASWTLNGSNVPSSTTSSANAGADGPTKYGAEQVISTDITITSKTVVPVLVGAKVKAVVTQGNPSAVTANQVTLSAAEIVAADQTKSTKKVCLWLGAGVDHDTALKNGRKAIVKNATGTDTANNIKEWLLCSQGTPSTATATQVKWNENQRIYMIPAWSNGAGKTCVLNFGGQMVQQPLNNPWVPGDKITPTLIIDLQVQKNLTMPTIEN